MSYTLVEPCCGSAAFSLHMLGAKRAIVPYQGSKWRIRSVLAETAQALGFDGPPNKLEFTDTGPWADVLRVVLQPVRRERVTEVLRAWADVDPEEKFHQLQHQPVDREPTRFAASFLFLQRLAFSGKAVTTIEESCVERWNSPGFNATSAFGKPATHRFGAIQPMIPSLIRVLESYDALPHVELSSRRKRAAPPSGRVERPTLVYLDPPYQGVTGYTASSMGRPEVEQLAQAWRSAGAAVIVSEQGPLDLPGWLKHRVSRASTMTNPFKSKSEEWLTFAGGLSGYS